MLKQRVRTLKKGHNRLPVSFQEAYDAEQRSCENLLFIVRHRASPPRDMPQRERDGRTLTRWRARGGDFRPGTEPPAMLELLQWLNDYRARASPEQWEAFMRAVHAPRRRHEPAS